MNPDDIREVIVAMAEMGLMALEGGVVKDFRREEAWNFLCRQSSK